MRRRAARARSQERITHTVTSVVRVRLVQTDSGGLNDIKCIINELLMYTDFHMYSCTGDILETILSRHFSGENVDAARLCLVRKFDHLGLFHPDIKKQWQSSNNRTEVMTMCGYIIRALEELERNYIEVYFVAKIWDILPKFNLSIADRLAELEAKFNSQGQTLFEMKVQSLSLNDQLKLVRNDIDVHGQQLLQILSNVILKKNDRNTPTAAEVLVASSS